MSPRPDSTKSRVKPVYLLIGVLFYYGAIFVLSHLPGDAIDNWGFDVWDKAAHSLLYFPLGILVSSILFGMKKRLPTPLVFVLNFVVILILGTLDEFHQYFVPGRFSSALDVVADLTGAMGGSIAVLIYRSNRSKE